MIPKFNSLVEARDENYVEFIYKVIKTSEYVCKDIDKITVLKPFFFKDGNKDSVKVSSGDNLHIKNNIPLNSSYINTLYRAI